MESRNFVLVLNQFHVLFCDAESQSNTAAMAVTLANLAFAQACLGQLSEAELTFHQAEKAATTVGDHDTLARVTEGLAAVYYRNQQQEKCLPFLKKSISLLSTVSRDTSADIDRLVNKISTVAVAETKSRSNERNKTVGFAEQQLAEHSLQVTQSSLSATAVVANESLSSSSASSLVSELPEVSSSLSPSESELEVRRDVRPTEAQHVDIDLRQPRRLDSLEEDGPQRQTSLPTGAAAAKKSQSLRDRRKAKKQGSSREKQILSPPSDSPQPSGDRGSHRFSQTSQTQEGAVVHRRIATGDADLSSPLLARMTKESGSRSRRQQKALAGFGTNTPTGLQLSERHSAVIPKSPPSSPPARQSDASFDVPDSPQRSSVCVIL